MLMLGRRLSGTEALEWGIVHECVPDPDVTDRARALAAQLAAGPTVALGLVKWLVNSGNERSLKDQLTAESLAMELSSRSPDFREGLAAFIGKRDPRFSGR
jgi:2-(1,2-epoxy-1,2-dihydrophenyl)acetyl-CoA isomerase